MKGHKIAVLALLVVLGQIKQAKAGLLDLSGLTQLTTEAAKSAKIGLAVSVDGERESAYYAGFKPTFAGAWVHDHVEFCLGATAKSLPGEYRLLASPMVNVRPIIDKLFTLPFTIPEVWVGPTVRAPSFGETWTWKQNVGGMIAVRTF